MSERKLMDWLGSVFTGEGLRLHPPEGLDGEDAALALRIYSECGKIDTYAKLYMQTLNSMEKYCEMSIRALSAMIKIGACTGSDIDALCRHTLEVFSRDLEIENCSIMMLDDQGRNLMLVAGRGKGDRYAGGGRQIQGVTIKIGDGIAGKVAETGVYISVSDVSADPSFASYNAGVDISSLLCVPIKSDEKIIGVLNFSHPLVEAFDNNTINIMILLSNFVGQMITIATLHNEISVWNEKLRLEVDRKTLQLSEKNLELNNLNRNLDERVQAALENLRQQEYMLIQQSKLATMGEMIGAISHQWRQPLNTLGIIVQDLQDAYEFGEFDKKYLDDTVVKTMEQIQYMSNTIDDFRDFFKPSKEKVNFAVNSAVKEVIYLIHDQLKKAHIRISIECRYDDVLNPGEGKYDSTCAANDLMVYGYPNEFKQAILNILVNARDAVVRNRHRGAMDPKESGEILVELSKTDDTAVLDIQDNGGGIPEDVIDRIFDPYFTTKDSEGTGIGLHMAKIIIEHNMCGRIRASNGARGAVFTIELMLATNLTPITEGCF
jgi:signal transduction histidine kinase